MLRTDLIARVKKPLRAEDVRNLDTTAMPQRLWGTARHEASHFFAGMVHGFFVGSVAIRLPGTRVSKPFGGLRAGEAGVVSMYQNNPDRGNPIGRFAGPAADLHMNGLGVFSVGSYSREEVISGRDLTREQMCSPMNDDLYLQRAPSSTEVTELAKILFKEAHSLVSTHWDYIELVAAILITHCNKTDGILRNKRLNALKQMTEAYIDECIPI